ncbi:Phage gp6-like head-tail connector protein [Terrisporobacter glycolicus]|nr:Phage gp6-like head-tail connector protein [Terrisporobacter glycolicus]
MDKRLLQELKEHLNITWDEEETNRKLERIINDAILTLNWKLGAKIDYSEGQEHNLFLNYCMYAYNNCTNEFDSNYFNEIMQLRQKYEVINYEENKQL